MTNLVLMQTLLCNCCDSGCDCGCVDYCWLPTHRTPANAPTESSTTTEPETEGVSA